MVKLLYNGAGSGDWYILIVNGEIYFEGHSIPTMIWLNIIEECFNGDIEYVPHLTDEQLYKE